LNDDKARRADAKSEVDAQILANVRVSAVLAVDLGPILEPNASTCITFLLAKSIDTIEMIAQLPLPIAIHADRCCTQGALMAAWLSRCRKSDRCDVTKESRMTTNATSHRVHGTSLTEAKRNAVQ